MTHSVSPPRPPREAGSVRLKVAYKSPEALLDEFTRSVGQGNVTLHTRRPVELGTRFVFEMHARGVGQPLEVVGEVVRVEACPGERYELTVRYGVETDRAALDAVLQRIFAAHEHEKLRKDPRLPLNVRAVQESAFAPAYYVRDISRGGVGLEVDAPMLPRSVQVGTPFLLELMLPPDAPLLLPGEVVWTSSSARSRAAALLPGFGAAFRPLPVEVGRRLESLLALVSLPSAPWKARVRLGSRALEVRP